MKTFLLIIPLQLLISTAFAQIDDNSFEIASTDAEMPPPDDYEYRYFLKKNLKYPKEAAKAGIEGTVSASFTVASNGHLLDGFINSGIGSRCDQIVLDFIERSPPWSPGSVNGVKVPHRVKADFIFTLKGKEILVQKRESLSLIEDYDEESFRIYEEVDSPAQIRGGKKAYLIYLKENLQYPPQAQRMGVKGKVFFEFIVEKDGSVSNVEIIKGIGAGCDEETIRVITEMPKWIPARNNGKVVREKRKDMLVFMFGN